MPPNFPAPENIWQRINYYLPPLHMKNRLANNLAAIIMGSLIGLIFPILLVVDHLLSVHFYLADKIYFLTYVLGPFLGVIVTDFLLMFLAGYLAADKSFDNKLLSSLAVGVIVPTVTAILNWGLLFLDFHLVINIFIFSLYAFLGGLCDIYLPFRHRKSEMN